MPLRTDLTDGLLALIPEDGSRITNAELRMELLDLADEPFSDEEFEAAKDHVVAMGAAETARGRGGGLKAPGLSPPPRAAAPSGNGRSRPSGNWATTALTGELRN